MWAALGRSRDRPPNRRGDQSSTPSRQTQEVATDSLFVMQPHIDWLESSVAREDREFVLRVADLWVDESSGERWPLTRARLMLETSKRGVFAAGDVRHGSIKRVAGAVGEGARSILLISQYLRGSEPRDP